MAILPPPASPRNFAPYGASGLAPGGAARTMPTPLKVPRNPKSPAPKAGRAGSMPKPTTDLQSAQQQVAAAYDPVLQQIKDAYNQMIQSTGDQYNAGSKQLADLYGQYGPRVQQAYSQAGQGLAAVQGMLAATQQGQGVSAASDLARQLQGIDASTAGRVSGNFGQNLQGEALANATAGGNNLAALLAEGAHAGQYGAILPGVGGQIGFQGLQQALGTLNANQKDELAKLAAEEPGAVQAALGNITTAKNQKAQIDFEHAVAIWQATGKLPAGYAKILGLPAGTPTLSAQPKSYEPKIVHTADGSVIAVNPTTGQTIANISGPKPPGSPKSMKPTTFKGTDGRTYIYNPASGTAKAIAGQSGPKPPGDSSHPAGLHGLTQNEYQGKAADALGGARTYHQVWTDANGNKQPPLTWQGYLTHGLKQHIPMWILIEQGKKVYSPAEIANSGARPGG